MTAKRVILSVDNNRGYSADQVPTSTTLADLLNLVENAIEQYGEDVIVVTHDSSNRMAGWGALDQWADITACDDCPECGESPDECCCDEDDEVDG